MLKGSNVDCGCSLSGWGGSVTSNSISIRERRVIFIFFNSLLPIIINMCKLYIKVLLFKLKANSTLKQIKDAANLTLFGMLIICGNSFVMYSTTFRCLCSIAWCRAVRPPRSCAQAYFLDISLRTSHGQPLITIQNIFLTCS